MISGLLLAFLPAPVTFEAKAETVANVVARLSEVTGTPLLCAPDVGNRRIVAIVRNADPLDFRAHLADAVGGFWIETPKGYRLEILPKKRAEDEQRHKKLRVEWIRQALKEFQKVEPNAWTESEARKQFVARKEEKARAVERGFYPNENVTTTPATRAAYRLLSAMAPESVADIEWGERRVFTTRVRGRQVSPLPEIAPSVVKTFRAEFSTMQEVLLGQPDLGEGFTGNMVMTSGEKITDALKGEPTDITLVVSRTAFSPDMHIVVWVSAANGTIVNSSYFQLFSQEKSLQGTPGPSGELWEELGKIPVRLSPEVKEWFDFRDYRVVRPPSEAPESVRYPEKFDPLGLLYTDAFRAVAESKKCNVVAQVGDLDFANYIRLDSAAHLRRLFSAGGDNVTLKDGWLTIRAKDPIESDQASLDRKVLGTYLRGALKDGYDSNTNFAPLARYNRGLRYHPMQTAALWALRLDRLSGEGLAEPNLLQLIETMEGTTQRKTVRDLTATQRTALEFYLFRENTGLFVGLLSNGRSVFDRIEFLPNVGFPDGLPPDLVVDLKVTKEDVAVRAPLTQEPGGEHNIEVAPLLAVQPPTSDARFRMGKAVRYEIVIGIPERLEMKGYQNDYSADLSKPAVTFLQLPEWFRQKVDSFRSGNPE